MKVNIYNERRLYIYVCLSLLYLYIANAANGFAGYIGVSQSKISFWCKVVVAAEFILSIPTLGRKVKAPMIILPLLSIVFTLLNFIFFPDLDTFFISTCTSFFTICMPLALVCMALDDMQRLKKYIVNIAYIETVFSLILVTASLAGKIKFYSESYSMGFGYAMLIPVLVLLFQTMTERTYRLTNILCVIVLILTLLSFGSRGPLIGISLFILFYLLRFYYKKRNSAAVLLLIVAAILLFGGFSYILEMLSSTLEKIGISSRAIRTLLNKDTLSESSFLSGRDTLWNPLISEIRKAPLKIRGINAEWKIIGVYAHNLIIELLYQFGCLGGGLFLFFLGKTILQQLFNPKLSLGNELTIIFAFATFPGLMLSSSIWSSSAFWIWFGFSFGTQRNGY